MRKVAVLFFCLILAISSFAQEKVNITFDIIEQYSLSIGEPINLSTPKSNHKMKLSFDGLFLKIDHLSGKNFLMEKVNGWSIDYKYDKSTGKVSSKLYILDIFTEGKHLYYIIEISQLSSSVLKSIYIPYMAQGLIMSYSLLQSDFYFGEKIQ